MALLDIDALNDSFINVYQPGFNEQQKVLVSETVQVIEAHSKPGDGVDVPRLEARFGLELVPSHITGFIGEAEDFPDPEAPVRDEALFRLVEHTYRLEISDRAIRRGAAPGGTENGAYDDVLERETKNVADQIARWRSIMAWHEGHGVLARCGTTGGSPTANVVVPLASTTTKAQMRTFRRNDPISIGTTASPNAVTARVLIEGVDVANKTLTVSTAVIVTSTDRIFEAGSGGSTTWGDPRPVSIPEIIGDGTLHGVSSSTHPEWQSFVSTAGADRVLDETLAESVLDEVALRGGDINPSEAIFTAANGVVRRTKVDFGPLVQYTMVEQENLKVGIKAIELCGHALVKDKYHPDKSAHFIDVSSSGVKYLSTGDGYVSLDGGPGAPSAFTLDSKKRVYVNRGAAYWNLGAKSRSKSARIEKLLESD